MGLELKTPAAEALEPQTLEAKGLEKLEPEALELETQERKAPELKALKAEVLETLEPEVRETLEPQTLEAEGLEKLEAEALELGTLEWQGARRLGRQMHEQREQLSVQPPAQQSRTMPHDALLSPAPRAPPIPADEGPTPS